jgi:hypothetical protein
MTPEEFRDLIIASHHPRRVSRPDAHVHRHMGRWATRTEMEVRQRLRRSDHPRQTHNVHVHRGQAIVYQPASIR